jgi:hypothetical protein
MNCSAHLLGQMDLYLTADLRVNQRVVTHDGLLATQLTRRPVLVSQAW